MVKMEATNIDSKVSEDNHDTIALLMIDVIKTSPEVAQLAVLLLKTWSCGNSFWRALCNKELEQEQQELGKIY